MSNVNSVINFLFFQSANYRQLTIEKYEDIKRWYSLMDKICGKMCNSLMFGLLKTKLSYV